MKEIQLSVAITIRVERTDVNWLEGRRLEERERGYILESGRMLLEGTAGPLLTSEEVRKVFLGLQGRLDCAAPGGMLP